MQNHLCRCTTRSTIAQAVSTFQRLPSLLGKIIHYSSGTSKQLEHSMCLLRPAKTIRATASLIPKPQDLWLKLTCIICQWEGMTLEQQSIVLMKCCCSCECKGWRLSTKLYLTFPSHSHTHKSDPSYDILLSGEPDLVSWLQNRFHQLLGKVAQLHIWGVYWYLRRKLIDCLDLWTVTVVP